MFAETYSIAVTIEMAAAAMLGGAIGGAITFVGKLIVGWLRNRSEAEVEARKEHNGLVEKVIVLTKESAGAVATGTTVIAQHATELRTFGERLADMEAELKAMRSGNNQPQRTGAQP